MTQREKAVTLLDELRANGFLDSDLLEHLIYNYMSGDDALDSLKGWLTEECESQIFDDTV